MNANTNIVLHAVARSADVVNTEIDSLIETGGTKINKLSDLFVVAGIHADYDIEQSTLSEITIGNGTGYYDPLISAVILDDKGAPVAKYSTVAAFDGKSQRRLVIVVLDKGRNVIIHDRYSINQNAGTIVSTGGPEKSLLNMNPCWAEGVSFDMFQAATTFGFEVDRRDGSVYMPKWKTDNWFKANAQFLNLGN